MIRSLALALLLATGSGSGCATTQPSTQPAATMPHAPLLVVPASDTVTGTYPTSCRRAAGDDPRLPVRSCTPGSIRDDLTNPTPRQLAVTICRPGWTATVRPSRDETGPVKRAAMRAYGEPAGESGIVELDHLVPLELGGSNDVSNLWPEVSDEPGEGFRNTKDSVENDLRVAVCAGHVTLAAAQTAIASNWTTAEQNLGIRSHR